MHVRRGAAFGQLSAQAASPAASLAPRAASALQFLLRCRWLPISEDTTFTTVSRPQGLPHGHGGADLNYAAWRQRGSNAAADPSHWRQPPHDSALGNVVARCIHDNSVLEGSTRKRNAAGRRGPATVSDARALRWRRG